MNEKRSRFAAFIAELGRRHVGRVAIGYAAVAFILLQTGEIVLPAFAAPEWGLRLMVMLSLLGFPVAIALAWVYEITPGGIRRTPDLASTPGGRPSGRFMPRVAFLGLTFATVAAVGWWVVRWTVTDDLPGGTTPTATAPLSAAAATPISSLAVLPLQDFSEERGQEYFAAGLHEALIHELSQIEALRVVSRTSVVRYAGTTMSMPEIAEELRVQGIVEGSVLRDGERIRITVQLIDGASDTHLWSSSYERELRDIITLQNEVARAIAREIQAELTPEETTRLAALSTVVPEAHEAYLRGRYEQSKGTPQGFESAIEYYERALQVDSTYAPAYAGLAGSQLLLEMSDTPMVADGLREAVEAAQRAIVLDSSSSEALAVLAGINLHIAEATDSLGNLKIVVGLDSIEVPSPEWLVRHTELGRQLELVSASRRRPDRWDSVATSRYIANARRLTAGGAYDAAIEILVRVLERDSSEVAAWDALEQAYAARGDYVGAAEVRRERVARTGDELEAAERAELERQAADLERAVAERGELGYWQWQRDYYREREASGRPFSHVDYAAALVALGDHDAAFEHLARAYEVRDPNLLSLRSGPVWDPIRPDRRFQELQRRIRETRWEVPPPPPR